MLPPQIVFQLITWPCSGVVRGMERNFIKSIIKMQLSTFYCGATTTGIDDCRGVIYFCVCRRNCSLGPLGLFRPTPRINSVLTFEWTSIALPLPGRLRADRRSEVNINSRIVNRSDVPDLTSRLSVHIGPVPPPFFSLPTNPGTTPVIIHPQLFMKQKQWSNERMGDCMRRAGGVL